MSSWADLTHCAAGWQPRGQVHVLAAELLRRRARLPRQRGTPVRPVRPPPAPLPPTPCPLTTHCPARWECSVALPCAPVCAEGRDKEELHDDDDDEDDDPETRAPEAGDPRELEAAAMGGSEGGGDQGPDQGDDKSTGESPRAGTAGEAAATARANDQSQQGFSSSSSSVAYE